MSLPPRRLNLGSVSSLSFEEEENEHLVFDPDQFQEEEMIFNNNFHNAAGNHN